MLHDLRYAIRTLRQNPGFALAALVSLALGVGANSAVFSLADGILLRPMPVPHPSEIIQVQAQLRGESFASISQYSALSYRDFRDLRDRGQSFAGLSAVGFVPFGFATQRGALPQMKFGNLVSAEFFNVMQLQPELGRFFRPDEDQAAGRDAVVVLSHDLWQTEFGGCRDVVGQTIFLNGIDFTVIGVAPEKFTGPYVLLRSALYAPIAMGPRLAGDASQRLLEDRGSRSLFVYGRLKPGVSLAQAAAETNGIGQQLTQAYPQTNKTCSLVAGTDLQARFRSNAFNATILGFLLLLALVVLLIACANVMNLLLSRARARSREIAVRIAIGAGRGRLIRQLLTESVVIALLGGVLGLVVAQVGVDLFSRLPVPGDIPIVFDLRLDTRALLFAIGASLVSALLFGLVPAIQSAGPDLVPALKSGRAEGDKPRRFAGRNALVMAQVAASLVLLVFASQAYRGASLLLASPLGFRTDHLLMAGFNPELARYTPAQTQEFYRRLLDRARNLTGVQSAALVQTLPMTVGTVASSRVVPEGLTLPPGAEAVTILSNTVSDAYFHTAGTRIVEGREFQATDRADSPRVAIVNEQFARKYFPKGTAIGKRLRMNGPDGPLTEIVGVAAPSKYVFVVEPPFEFMYVPLSQNPVLALTLLLHTTGPSSTLAEPVRELVHSLDPGQPVISMRTMEEYFDQRARQSVAILINAIGGMGLLGLVLALVGLYGLMTYSVGLRQHEIGIRMAIGADPRGVLKMVLRQGMVLAGSGVIVGLALSLAAGRPATTVIGSSYFYLPLVALVVVGLLGAAALGAFIPARRASLVDPISVLRQE